MFVFFPHLTYQMNDCFKFPCIHFQTFVVYVTHFTVTCVQYPQIYSRKRALPTALCTDRSPWFCCRSKVSVCMWYGRGRECVGSSWTLEGTWDVVGMRHSEDVFLFLFFYICDTLFWALHFFGHRAGIAVGLCTFFLEIKRPPCVCEPDNKLAASGNERWGATRQKKKKKSSLVHFEGGAGFRLD